MLELRKSRELRYRQLCREKKWSEARVPLMEWLNDTPRDHWVLTRIGETYFEEGAYDKAIEYEQRALKLKPRCPLATYDYAEALFMLEHYEESILLYKNIIHRGINRIASGECGEGLPWARSLVNDARYMVGRGYASLGQFELARKYLKIHLANRGRKTTSIYSIHKAKKNLEEILERLKLLNE